MEAATLTPPLDSPLVDHVQVAPYASCGRAPRGWVRVGGAKCRDPRCSRECRCAWAAKEAATCEAALEAAAAAGAWLAAGVLKLEGRASATVNAAAIRGFLAEARREARRLGVVLEIRAYVDVGRAGGTHWHFLLHSSAPVSESQVKAWWSKASGSSRNPATAPAIRSVRAACIYATKSNRLDLPLLARGTKLRAVSGTRGFFGPGGQTAVWARLRAGWYGEPEPAAPEPAPVLEPAAPTAPAPLPQPARRSRLETEPQPAVVVEPEPARQPGRLAVLEPAPQPENVLLERVAPQSPRAGRGVPARAGRRARAAASRPARVEPRRPARRGLTTAGMWAAHRFTSQNPRRGAASTRSRRERSCRVACRERLHRRRGRWDRARRPPRRSQGPSEGLTRRRTGAGRFAAAMSGRGPPGRIIETQRQPAGPPWRYAGRGGSEDRPRPACLAPAAGPPGC